MELTLLGTGTPTPNPDRQGSANLVQVGGQYLLFDAGRGATTQLSRIGVHPKQIDHVFITHHHFDHISCLDDVLLTAWNNGRGETIHVWGPEGTADIVDALLNRIYVRDIAFRLKEAEHLDGDLVDLREIVRVRDIGPGPVHDEGAWSVSAARVEHGHGLGLSHEEWPCLGYRLEAEGKVLAISGDAVECAGLDALARHADLLLQCCYMAEAEIDNHDREVLSTYVLGSAAQAGRTAARAAVKKLVLTHLAPKSAAMLAEVEADARRNFDGEIVVGADLMTIEV
ncbi:MAG: MBL fold metallo-hydrolase [Alphaproteobacteria bacterium]